MIQMLNLILGLILSYLIGSIPTAFIFAKVLKGLDIRTFGSGNVGATNALRLLGKKTGLAVLLIDILKGLICVTFLVDALPAGKFIYFKDVLLLRFYFGILAIMGHSFSVFLRFKGGKGVATSLGVLLGMGLVSQPMGMVLGFTILVWLITFIITRYVSLASILAAGCFPLGVFFWGRNLSIFMLSLGLGAFIIFKHKSNIIRLLRREETRLDIFGRKP
ncbi:MAG: glycerol-3-phosphate 1-O-acyltransferase PlsY [Candidatus Omnitrophota bacterium]